MVNAQVSATLLTVENTHI